MNNVIARTNTKGQFVLPVAMRKALGITPDTNLHISLEDKVITISPLPPKPIQTKKTLYEILKSTQGALAGDDWPETEKRLEKLAKKELKELHKNTW